MKTLEITIQPELILGLSIAYDNVCDEGNNENKTKGIIIVFIFFVIYINLSK